MARKAAATLRQPVSPQAPPAPLHKEGTAEHMVMMLRNTFNHDSSSFGGQTASRAAYFFDQLITENGLRKWKLKG